MHVRSFPDRATLSARRADGMAVLVLAGLTALFFGRLLFTRQALFFGDALMAVYPALDLWREYVAGGHLPLWNPYLLNGIPFLADAQFSTLYPSLLLNLVLPPHRALAVDLALHVFVLALFTYVFLRRRGLAWGPGLLGAATLAFSGFVAVRLTQPSLIRTMAWLPALLLMTDGLSRQTARVRSVGYAAALFALQIFAGHLQTMLITTLLVLAYAGWQITHLEKGSRPLSSRLLGVMLLVALSLALAVILGAAQVLPGAELVRHSDRSGGKGFEFASSYSLPLRQLVMLLSPNLFGNPAEDLYWGEWLYWEMVGYAGVASLLLAAIAVLFSRHWDRMFWAAVATAGVALAVSGSPVYQIAYWVIPGLSYFRAPARFLLWYGWAIAVLAAYGAEWLRSASVASPKQWRFMIVLMLSLVAVAIYWGSGSSGVHSTLQRLASEAMRSAQYLPQEAYPRALELAQDAGIREGRRLAFIWVAAVLGILAVRSDRIRPWLSMTMLIALVVGDLFAYGMNLYPTIDAREIYRPLAVEQRMDLEEGAYRVLTTPAFTFRIWLRDMARTTIRDTDELLRYRMALVPNISAHRRISNVWGYSPIGLTRSTQFISLGIAQATRQQGRSSLLDFMGARYIFTNANIASTHESVYGDGFYVWRNQRAFPRGFLATRYVVRPLEGLVARTLSGSWDPRVVILDRRPHETHGLRADSNPGQIVGRLYELSRVSFDLELERPAILVLSDTYYPGWKAAVDGVDVPIYRANHTFRAVVVPAGAKHVDFNYRPASVLIGGLVSVGAWGGLAGWGVLGLIRRRKGAAAFAVVLRLDRPGPAER